MDKKYGFSYHGNRYYKVRVDDGNAFIGDSGILGVGDVNIDWDTIIRYLNLIKGYKVEKNNIK